MQCVVGYRTWDGWFGYHLPTSVGDFAVNARHVMLTASQKQLEGHRLAGSC